jgi:hypothetical protein
MQMQNYYFRLAMARFRSQSEYQDSPIDPSAPPLKAFHLHLAYFRRVTQSFLGTTDHLIRPIIL